MSELAVKVPAELETQIKAHPEVDWSGVAREAFQLKTFEMELERSRKLRHLLFKTLISESKFKEEDALELGKRLNKDMLKELESKGLI